MSFNISGRIFNGKENENALSFQTPWFNVDLPDSLVHIVPSTMVSDYIIETALLHAHPIFKHFDLIKVNNKDLKVYFKEFHLSFVIITRRNDGQTYESNTKVVIN